jgi:Leucine Rich repeat
MARQEAGPEDGMTSRADRVSYPWRRFLRFRIRGLLVLVLVIGAGLWVVHEARIQRAAVTEIEKAGGMVKYDWRWREGDELPGGKPWAPKWLVNLMGVDYFGHVTAAWLVSPVTPADAALPHVGRLFQLQELYVYSESVSDAGIANLKGLASLSDLWLTRTKVPDAALAHLKGLTKLTRLHLGETQVTDRGLAHLHGMTNLHYLDLRYAPITDAGLTHLKGLKELSELHVAWTQVTDAGLQELKQALPRVTIYSNLKRY